MQKDHVRWYSHRLGRDMGVAVYGHYGLPVLAFPTSGGEEWELEQMGLIPALAPYIDAGRVKFFAVGFQQPRQLLQRRRASVSPELDAADVR